MNKTSTSPRFCIRLLVCAVCLSIGLNSYAKGEEREVELRLDKQEVMAFEHYRLSLLMDISHADHLTTKNGNWSDPTLWDGGVVPPAGSSVGILHQVTVDTATLPEYKTVIVKDTLSFSETQDSHLTLETLFVHMGGALLIGSRDKPLDRNIRAEIVFKDVDGSFDTVSDPLQLGLGIVSHGRVQMYGANIRPWSSLTTAPQIGATSMVLDGMPYGWRAGDEIVLAGMNANGDGDEKLTILSVDSTSRTVSFTPALSLNHVPPTHNKPGLVLKVHVINLTRNIEFRTNPADKGTIMLRGHTMFMHTNAAYMMNVRFKDMGRTDKSRDLSDAALDIKPVSGRAKAHYIAGITASGANQRARYPLHFHRAGLGGVAAVITGCSVDNSPGWGYVNHSSFVRMENNVAYNISGTAFVEEAGDGVGSFVGNVSIRTHGTGEREVAAIESRKFNEDFGFSGHGFWANGCNVEFSGNIAAGASGTAYAIYPTGIDKVEYHDGKDTSIEYGVPLNTVSERESSSLSGRNVGNAPLRGWENNIAYGSETGFQTASYHPMKEDHRQDFKDLLIYECNIGTHVGYSRGNGFIRLIVINDINNPHGLGTQCGNNAAELRYEHCYIEGTLVGYRVPWARSPMGIFDCYSNSALDLADIFESRPKKRGLPSFIDTMRFGTLDPQVVANTIAAIPSDPQQQSVPQKIFKSFGTQDLGQPYQGITVQTRFATRVAPGGFADTAGGPLYIRWNKNDTWKKVYFKRESQSSNTRGLRLPSGWKTNPSFSIPPQTANAVFEDNTYSGINPWSDRLVVADDSVDLSSGGGVLIDALSNDEVEASAPSLEVVIVVKPSHGTLVKNGSGINTKFQYTLTDSSFHGIDCFRYRLWYSDKGMRSHRNGQWSDGTVEIRIP